MNPAAIYAAEAEKAVLGSMIARPDVVIAQVEEQLRAEDFFVPAHQIVFKAIQTLNERSQAIDITTLHQQLVDQKEAEQIGSPGILAEVVVGVASHLNVGTYIAIVKKKATLRALQSAAMMIAEEISESPDDPERVLDLAENAIFKIADLSQTKEVEKLHVTARRAVDTIHSFQGKRGHLLGIPTGFAYLNELTCGWQPGDMIVAAARPGIGKTALALNFAREAIRCRYNEQIDAWVQPGYSVGFFSLEMTNDQLALRMLAAHSGVGLQRLRRGEVDEKGMQLLEQAVVDMQDMPLYEEDSSGLSIQQLRAKARRMKLQYKIDLLIIDYLQLLHSTSTQAKDNRQNEVAEISRGIKALAKELQIPVIVLAQLNRNSAESGGEPALHHLRESGAIEQDADLVMLLHRAEDAAEMPNSRIPYTLILAKQRNGPTDRGPLNFHKYCARFEEAKEAA